MRLLEEVRQLQKLPTPGKSRAIRVAAGVSQVRLSEELGIHRVTLARWESGKRRPRGRSRLAYAVLLDELRQEIGR